MEKLPGHFASLDIGKLPDDWLPITTAKSGLCGGMVYTVMDYYNAHLQPPGVAAPSMGSAPTSRDDPLFQHIRERLLASFDILGGGWRFLAYSSPLYPNGDEGVGQFVGLFLGRSWISYREQWPRIQDDLDAGRLSPSASSRPTASMLATTTRCLPTAIARVGSRSGSTSTTPT